MTSNETIAAQLPHRASAGRLFGKGVAESLAVLVAVSPVGLLFGALAVAKGLTVGDAMLMSMTVFAGASQIVAIELFEQSVPAWAILPSVLAVNFRHVLYSAAMTPIVRARSVPEKAAIFALLIDPQFALTQRRAEGGLPFSMAWYLGLGLTTYAFWIAATWIGASFGRLIEDPQAWALDMLFPIYFLGLVMGFRGRRHWGLVVLTSGIVSAFVYHAPSLGLPWLGAPWHVSLGALAGILVATLMPPKAPESSPAALEDVQP